MSKPANSWYGIVIKTIRRYPELKKRKAQMHNSNIIANYSAMPKSNTSSRTTENIAIRELKPADERELQAVEKAIGVMYSLNEGKEIMKIVELVDFKHTHLLRGAAFVYELDSRAEWIDPSCWKKANPGLGTIKSYEKLAEKVEKAKKQPALVKNLCCKEFNIRETSSEAWLNFEQLDNRDTFDLNRENKRLVWHHIHSDGDTEDIILPYPRYGIGGADLSSTTDLTAAKVIFKVPDCNITFVLSMYWLAEDLLETRIREDRIPYDKWRDRGLLRLSSGNSVNYKNVKAWFVEVQEELDIYIPYFGYDSWSAKYWVEDMTDYFGKNSMIPVQQGKKTLSDPMKRLGNDLQSKLIVYNNNPIDKWCFANTAYEEDRNGNIQPHKTSKPTRRIDGTAALLDARVIYENKQDEYMSMI